MGRGDPENTVRGAASPMSRRQLEQLVEPSTRRAATILAMRRSTLAKSAMPIPRRPPRRRAAAGPPVPAARQRVDIFMSALASGARSARPRALENSVAVWFHASRWRFRNLAARAAARRDEREVEHLQAEALDELAADRVQLRRGARPGRWRAARGFLPSKYSFAASAGSSPAHDLAELRAPRYSAPMSTAASCAACSAGQQRLDLLALEVEPADRRRGEPAVRSACAGSSRRGWRC